MCSNHLLLQFPICITLCHLEFCFWLTLVLAHLIRGIGNISPSINSTSFSHSSSTTTTLSQEKTLSLDMWYDCILVVHPKNLEAGELYGRSQVFKVCKSAHYLYFFTRYGKSKGGWLKKRTKKWERDIPALRKWQINTLRRVTPRWIVRSNRSGSFWNAWQRIQGRRSRGWKKVLLGTFLTRLSLGNCKPSLQS